MTRLQQFTNTLMDITGPQVGRKIVLQLFTPNNQVAATLEGGSVRPGIYTQKIVETDADGTYVIEGWTTEDLVPLGSSYLINEDGLKTVLAAVAYSASPVDVSDYYPTPSAGATLLMSIRLIDVDAEGQEGANITIGISDNATAPDLSKLRRDATKSFQSVIEGYVTLNMWPSVVLDPDDTVYVVIWGTGAYDKFQVPLVPHGYQGDFAGGTTYHKNLGTLASPADVVKEAGLLYSCVVTNSTGHTPPHADWIAFPGEPVEWNITESAGVGERVLRASNIAASESLAVIPDDPHQTPGTLDDQLANLGNRTGFVFVDKNNTYTVPGDVDGVRCDGSSHVWDVTLPASADRRKPIYLLVTDVTNAMNAVPDGSETIGAGSSLALSTVGMAVKLEPRPDGSGYDVYSYGGSGGGASPLTTKGDLFGHSTTDARIPVGSDGEILVADSGASLGVSWAAAPASGAVWTVISATGTVGTTTTNELVDATGGARTRTLPTAVGSTQRVTIKKKDASGNAVTIATTSAQTIDGASTFVLASQYDSVTLAPDNANWYVE